MSTTITPGEQHEKLQAMKAAHEGLNTLISEIYGKVAAYSALKIPGMNDEAIDGLVAAEIGAVRQHEAAQRFLETAMKQLETWEG
jgi:hypothetical protein